MTRLPSVNKPPMMLLALLISVGWASFIPSAWAIYDLEASRANTARVPVGIIGFVGDASLGDEVEEGLRVLMADLRRSTLFHARDLEMQIAGPPDESLGRQLIAKLGADEAVEVLLWAKLGWNAGRLELTGHIYDAARGRRVVGKRILGTVEQLRTMVHRFAGELIHQYTGNYGITRSRIAFISDLTGHKEVYVMDYDGPPKRVTSDRSLAVTPSLSADGKMLLYAGQKSLNWNIYQRDLYSGSRAVVLDFPGLNTSPAWHLKGDGFAVAVSKDGNREIYHVTASGSLKRLTNHPGDDVSPAWSSDGKHIAFTSNRGGSPQIYVKSTRGGRAKRITFSGRYNTEPDWSPTDKLVVFTCRADGYFHICITTAKGRKTRQLTSGPWDDEDPVFSPDGRHIAFSSRRGGRYDIYMMNLDGTQVERLTFNGANNTAPDWADSTPAGR